MTVFSLFPGLGCSMEVKPARRAGKYFMRPFWKRAALKIGVPLGVLASLLFPGRAHAQYSSMDTLGYEVKFSNGQQELHEGILVEPPDMNVMLSEDPYPFLHQDRWVTWVYNNPTDNLDNFWAGFDNLPESKRQEYIPNYQKLRNNPPHHEPDTDGEIVELYTFDISSNDNAQPLPVDFLDSSFRVGFAPDGSWVDIDWQTASETDNLGFRVLREVYDAAGRLKEERKDISGLIAGLGNDAFGRAYRFTDRGIAQQAARGDSVNYFIEQIDISGGKEEFGPRSLVWDGPAPAAGAFSLAANYPNPFNSKTTIVFSLPEPQMVAIDLFDLRGRHIKTIYSGREPAGYHEILFDGVGLASGVYLYRIQAGEYSAVRKMILLK